MDKNPVLCEDVCVYKNYTIKEEAAIHRKTVLYILVKSINKSHF